MALIGVRRALLKPRLVGPPVFTFQGQATGSTAGNITVTYATLACGPAFTNRVLAILIPQTVAGTPCILASATVNGSASGVTIYNIGQVSSPATSFDAVVALVPTGTTISLALTYSTANIFSNTPGAACFSADLTQFQSLVPSLTSVLTTAAATSMTQTFSVASNGSAVLAVYVGIGITNGTQAFTTPNTYNVTSDSKFGSGMWGHANNVSANGSAQDSVSWTTSGTGMLAHAIFR